MTGRVIACFAAVGCLVLSADARAAPRALLQVDDDADVALAGDEAVVGSPTPRGGISVQAVPLSGGAPRRLLMVDPPQEGWSASIGVTASRERVAARVLFDDETGLAKEWRVYDGAPTGPLRLARRVGVGEPWLPTRVLVDGPRLLLGETSFRPLRSRATVFSPGAAPEPVAEPGARLPEAFAGDLVASFGPGPRSRVLIADWRSGAVRARIAVRDEEDDVSFGDLSLTSAGRVVASVDGRLVSASPGRRARRVSGSGRRELNTPRIVGRRIVASTPARFYASRIVVLDPRRRRVRAIGAPSTALGPVVAGSGRAVWLANGCLLTAALGERAPGARGRGICPRSEVTLEEDDQVLRGRSLRVRVNCVAAPRSGCRGSVLLRREEEGRVLGRRGFRVGSGRSRVTSVRLSRRGVEGVRRMRRREGDAFVILDARVRDGRVVRSPGSGALIAEQVGRRRRGG